MAMAAPHQQGGPSSAIVPLTSDQGFSVTEAPYALNRDRLMENLASEASSDQPSVVVEVNNAGGNVNLQCSPAFLNAIVMPTLLTLGFPYTRVVTNLVLSLASPPARYTDITGVTQYDLLQFTFSSNTLPPTLLGNISVHLHYTTRKLQVQGSTLTPDGRTAASWFTEAVLDPLLAARSKAISFNSSTTSNIHNMIIEAFSKLKSCAPAGATAGRPAPVKPVCCVCRKGWLRPGNLACPDCRQVFHKGCEPKHICTPAIAAIAACTNRRNYEITE